MCPGPSGRVEMLVADDNVTLKPQSVHRKLKPASSQGFQVTAVQESPGPLFGKDTGPSFHCCVLLPQQRGREWACINDFIAHHILKGLLLCV